MVHIFPTSRNERALRNFSPNGKHPWSSLVSSRIAVKTINLLFVKLFCVSLGFNVSGSRKGSSRLQLAGETTGFPPVYPW